MLLGYKLLPKVYQTNIYIPYKTLFRSVNLSYKLIGKGSVDQPPIFIFHGLLSRRKHWKGLAKTIYNLTKRSVVIFDHRNHGSSPHVSSHTYEELAGDFIELLDKLEVERASLVGHNMGGRTAMCTALTAPKRVSGLIVVDISPVSTDQRFLRQRDLLLAMKDLKFKYPKKVLLTRNEAKKVLKHRLLDDVITTNEVLDNIDVKPDGYIGWICNLDVLIKSFDQITSFPSTLRRKIYKGPTLFIGGQLSDFIPADDLLNIRELFPRAVIRYVKNASHQLHHEDPHSFLELLITFIKSHH